MKISKHGGSDGRDDSDGSCSNSIYSCCCYYCYRVSYTAYLFVKFMKMFHFLSVYAMNCTKGCNISQKYDWKHNKNTTIKRITNKSTEKVAEKKKQKTHAT